MHLELPGTYSPLSQGIRARDLGYRDGYIRGGGA